MKKRIWLPLTCLCLIAFAGIALADTYTSESDGSGPLVKLESGQEETGDALELRGARAGATYPYHKDPEDRNIRIAPSFATLEEVREAIRIFTVVVRLASVEKLLSV